MTKRKNPFSRIRLVYRRSSALLKCVVLVTIVFSTAALVMLGISLKQTRQQTQTLRGQAVQIQEENRQLTEDIAGLGTMDSIKKIAEEELGLVDPDTEFFRPVDNNP